MKVLIIEDEIRASQQLSAVLKNNFTNVNILDTLESVEESINWFRSHSSPDLIFMDIQLADGLSFEIFESTTIDAPVIFTTAYDQYSIKAFKVNSIDYLLKPIVEKDLIFAVEKYEKLHRTGTNQQLDRLLIEKLTNNLSVDKTRKRFIVKEGASMTFVQIEDISFFYSEEGVSFLITQHNKRYIIDMTLEAIEKDISSNDFFRINRHQIISIPALQKINPYFNNRLSLELKGTSKQTFIVSRKRVSQFKQWVNQ